MRSNLAVATGEPLLSNTSFRYRLAWTQQPRKRQRPTRSVRPAQPVVARIRLPRMDLGPDEDRAAAPDPLLELRGDHNLLLRSVSVVPVPVRCSPARCRGRAERIRGSRRGGFSGGFPRGSSGWGVKVPALSYGLCGRGGGLPRRRSLSMRSRQSSILSGTEVSFPSFRRSWVASALASVDGARGVRRAIWLGIPSLRRHIGRLGSQSICAPIGTSLADDRVPRTAEKGADPPVRSASSRPRKVFP